MIVIYAGWDAVDAMMSHVLLSAGRTALVAYGEVVWSWRPDAGVQIGDDAPHYAGDGDNKARSPGRARRKP